MDGRDRVITAQANLIAQGLARQTDKGIRVTELGMERARGIWGEIPDEHKLLLIPFLRKQLWLVFPEETNQ